MTETFRIYALSGPDMKVRCVGRTKQSLFERGMNHFSAAKNGKCELHGWLRACGEDFVIRELECGDCDGTYKSKQDALSRERWWVHHYLEQGCDLFNVKLRPKRDAPFTIIELDHLDQARERADGPV